MKPNFAFFDKFLNFLFSSFMNLDLSLLDGELDYHLRESRTNKLLT